MAYAFLVSTLVVALLVLVVTVGVITWLRYDELRLVLIPLDVLIMFVVCALTLVATGVVSM